MDRQYYLDCIDEGKKLYVRMLGAARGLMLHLDEEIEYMVSEPHGCAEYIFNFNIPDSRAAEVIEELMADIKEKKMPGYVLISPLARPQNIVEILESKGFKINRNNGSGMAMDLDKSVIDLKIPEGVEVSPVRDEDTLAVWAEIVNKALFGFFSFERIRDMYQLKNTEFFMGYIDGKPVSTSMAIMSDAGEIAAVEWVSTLEEYRNRGAGRAVTIASIKYMYERGVKTAVLHATPSGEKIYEKVGFKGYYNCTEAIYGE